ncbi:MAG: hypothetical protein HOM58_12690 [Rhodospirillaceae bacterium]|jgi:hypothetical protein|nr:hypothetical protein [Rhodospirillaceae bacterium]MBT5456330.1 hypothetical protein [Rhodospirillaceae bacterium]
MSLIPQHRRATAWFILFILAVVILFIATSYQYKLTDRMFPLMVGYVAIPLLILDLLTLTDTRMGEKISIMLSAKTPTDVDEASDSLVRPVKTELIVFLWMALLVLGIYLAGFLPVIPVFVFCWMKFRGGYGVAMSGYLALGTIVFVYVLFELILQYELYPGIYLYWTG